jgi:hypothetical protein
VPAAPNRIGFNHDNGIELNNTGGSGNRVADNEFRSNTGLAIDLGANGVTENDAGANDGDTGPNALQNFPTISALSRTSAGIHIEGGLDRPSGATVIPYSITVYSSASCAPSGNGGGERLLGSFPFLTLSGANESFSLDFETDVGVPVGSFITLTATNNNTDDTSEFSDCVALDPNALTYVVNTTNDLTSATACTAICGLRQALTAANAHAGGDRIHFNAGNVLAVITPASALPSITGALTIDGYTQPGAAPNTAAAVSNAAIRVEIDGTGTASVAGLSVCASDVTIRGLSVIDFDRHGIVFGEQPGAPPVRAGRSRAVV